VLRCSLSESGINRHAIRASTETAFLEIVRQHNIREEEGRAGQAQRGGFTRWFRRS
jgi:predicted N-formylglutamate amidohydrolase